MTRKAKSEKLNKKKEDSSQTDAPYKARYRVTDLSFLFICSQTHQPFLSFHVEFLGHGIDRVLSVWTPTKKRVGDRVK